MSELTIRRLTIADAPGFKRLRLKGLADHPDAFTSTVADWDQPIETFIERIEDAHVIGAFENDRMIGHCLLATHAATMEKTKHKVELWSVYLAPEARGRGAASAMLSHAIEAARRLGYIYVKLRVGEHNAPARKLYESLGFVIYGREEDYLRLSDGRSITELMMQKAL